MLGASGGCSRIVNVSLPADPAPGMVETSTAARTPGKALHALEQRFIKCIYLCGAVVSLLGQAVAQREDIFRRATEV